MLYKVGLQNAVANKIVTLVNKLALKTEFNLVVYLLIHNNTVVLSTSSLGRIIVVVLYV